MSGYLPGWAEHDPSEADVPAEALSERLAAICHFADFPGQRLRFTVVPGPGREDPANGDTYEEEAFLGGITCPALDDGSASHAPTVNMDLLPGYLMDGLTPDDLADLAEKLRAQADRIDGEIRPKLIAAREDWARRDGERGPCFQPPHA